MGKVHRLYVEGKRAGVYDGIRVPRLRVVLLRPDNMQGRVIVNGIGSDQAL